MKRMHKQWISGTLSPSSAPGFEANKEPIHLAAIYWALESVQVE